MTLFNRNWIGFAGNPLTGKTPTQTIVHADQGVVLTGQQQGAVAHAYKLFCDAITVSSFPGGYHVQNRTFADGTRVRMTSIAGVHQVHVWLVEGGDEGALPHGLSVVSNWGKTSIHKFDGTSWAIDKKYKVPQTPDSAGGLGGYNAIFKAGWGPGFNMVLPLIYNKSRTVWDYARHAAPPPVASGSVTYCVPVNLQYPAGGLPAVSVHKHHMLFNHKIVGLDNAVLYSMLEPDALLEDAEEPVMLPGSSDVEGVHAALHIYRAAQISPLFNPNLWMVRFCNEVLARTTEDAYTPLERNVVTLTTPLPPQSLVTAESTYLDLNESMTDLIYGVEFYFQSQVSYDVYDGHGIPGNPYYTEFVHGFAGSERRVMNIAPWASTVEYAMRVERSRGSGEPITIDKMVALPSTNTFEFAKLEQRMYYAAEERWRGGFKTVGFPESNLPGGSRFIGRVRYHRDRRDASHIIGASPETTIKLGWTDIKVVEGAVSGSTTAKYHKDSYTDARGGSDIMSRTFAVAGPQYTVFMGPSNRDYYVNQYNHMPAWQAEWLASVPGITETVLANEPLRCTGSYTYKTRHIIDYDHRARFYAAIRVEVTCTGPTWDQVTPGPSGILGQMGPTTNPTYLVRIYFETKWGGSATDGRLLVEKSCTRPAFEWPMKYAPFNIYVYPANDKDYPINYFVPPEIRPPFEFIDSFIALTKHQGVNENLAAQDYLPDAPEDAISPTGIELSYLKDGREIPHKRFVRGQLYARTFKLKDIGQALWLLPALMMDAPENNLKPPDGEWTPWFYLLDLKDVIDNTAFHVEVRNGVIEQWSDSIKDKSDTSTSTHALPNPADRNIKLYSV